MTFPKVRVRYSTYELETCDIHVRTLRDRLQFDDPAGAAAEVGIDSTSWPLFGVIWDSSQVLAHLMLDHDIEGKSILEAGCGIGLASLVLNHREADITATDRHPEAEAFLRYNASLNDGPEVPFVRTSWDDPSDERLQKFDLVIGSDLLYERDHCDLLATFIAEHSEDTCEVVMVDPGRGHHARFSKKMVDLGFSHSQRNAGDTNYLEKPFRGCILNYCR